MAELRFRVASEPCVWFVTGGLKGIKGTVAVTERCGYLRAVGKIKDGKNVPLTLFDQEILSKSYITMSPRMRSLTPLPNLDDSGDPIDIPMDLKSGNKDRLAELIPVYFEKRR